MSNPETVIVSPMDLVSGQFAVNYYGDAAALAALWKRDVDAEGRPRWYRTATYNDQNIAVGYTPRLKGKGRYRIEVYIPAQHGFARDVQYHVVDYTGGQRREIVCLFNQAPYSDKWAPLTGIATGGGPLITEFELDPAFADSGRVNVTDTTFISDPKKPAGFEITFGAMRWTPVSAPVGGGGVAPGGGGAPGGGAIVGGGGKFDSPVGEEADRRAPAFGVAGNLYAKQYPIWVPGWYDANPIGSRYELGPGKMAIHTGADLNKTGGQLADKQAPVHACADGIVRFSGDRTSWKGLVLVEHEVPGEAPVFIRYAHLEQMPLKAGDRVKRGEVVGLITLFYQNADGSYQNWHLHFDMSRDPSFATRPGYWPGDDTAAVRAFFIDPLEFLTAHH